MSDRALKITQCSRKQTVEKSATRMLTQRPPTNSNLTSEAAETSRSQVVTPKAPVLVVVSKAEVKKSPVVVLNEPPVVDQIKETVFMLAHIKQIYEESLSKGLESMVPVAQSIVNSISQYALLNRLDIKVKS